MISEEAMSTVVERFLRDRGFDVLPQVPLKTRRIDLVCVSPERPQITAIELKVKDWKSAFQQAMRYRLCADAVYIALWHDHVHRVPGTLLGEHGVGLMKVDSSVEVVQLAGSNHSIQPSLRMSIESYLAKNRLYVGIRK